MIDGINFTFYTADKNHEVFDFPDWVIEKYKDTGEDKDGSFASKDYLGLDLKLKPSINGGFNFIANGSVHKYYNNGEHNADQFTFLKVVKTILELTDRFDTPPGNCFIHGLEIGVNIELPYSPLRIFKNLVSYRSRSFTQINKRNARAGAKCALTEYSIKVYDKAKQSGIKDSYILRYEISVNKMRVIKLFNITTLRDLLNPVKVYALIELLNDSLKDIIWTDTSVNLNLLTVKEQKDWLTYSNPKTWANFNKHERRYALKAWHKLLHKYGTPPNLSPLILKTWDNLFLNEAEKLRPFHQHNLKCEAEQNATFSPLECTGKKSLYTNQNISNGNTSFSIRKKGNIISTSKKCISCNRDISDQRKLSVFCSEKKYGKSAKKCRNAKSNNQRKIKRIINQATTKNKFIIVMYVDLNGITYADVLHASELSLSKELFNMILSVSLLP